MSYKLLEVPNIAKNYPICASSCMMHEIKLMNQQSLSALGRVAEEKPQAYHSQMAKDAIKAVIFSQRRCENIAILDGINGDNTFSGTICCEVSEFFTGIHKTISDFLPDSFKNRFILQNRLKEPVYANLDPHKIETIIYNLISNSLYHGKADRIYLGFCVKENELSFWVRDNGIGILTSLSDSTALTDNISSNLLMHIPPGFKGIGLSVCRHYTDLMHGSIKYCNQKMGVKFIVTLPLVIPRTHEFHQDSVYEPDIYYMRLALTDTGSQD